MAISKVSKAEIDAAKANIDKHKFVETTYDNNIIYGNINNSKKGEPFFFADPNKKPNNKFIKKLKNKDIVDFFKPYGVDFDKNKNPKIERVPDEKNPEFVFVSCEFFEICFDDFDAEVVLKPYADKAFEFVDKSQSNNGPLVNSALIYRQCKNLGYNQNQAWSNIIAMNLLGKLNGYSKARQQYAEEMVRYAKQQKFRYASKNDYLIPTKVSDALSTLEDMKEAEINNVSNWIDFGGNPLDYFANKKD